MNSFWNHSVLFEVANSFFQFHTPWKKAWFWTKFTLKESPRAHILPSYMNIGSLIIRKKCPLFKWFPLIIDVKNAGFPWCWKHVLQFPVLENAGIWWKIKTFSLAFGQKNHTLLQSGTSPGFFWCIFIESWERNNNNKVPSIPASQGSSIAYGGITSNYVEEEGEGNHYLPQEFRN